MLLHVVATNGNTDNLARTDLFQWSWPCIHNEYTGKVPEQDLAPISLITCFTSALFFGNLSIES